MSGAPSEVTPALRAPPGMTSNLSNPSSEAYITIIVTVILIVITAPIVLLRLYTRCFINRRLWWDDCKCSLFVLLFTRPTPESGLLIVDTLIIAWVSKLNARRPIDECLIYICCRLVSAALPAFCSGPYNMETAETCGTFRRPMRPGS